MYSVPVLRVHIFSRCVLISFSFFLLLMLYLSQGGILNISRKERQQQEFEKSIQQKDEDNEEKPLLGRREHRIN